MSKEFFLWEACTHASVSNGGPLAWGVLGQNQTSLSIKTVNESIQYECQTLRSLNCSCHIYLRSPHMPKHYCSHCHLDDPPVRMQNNTFNQFADHQTKRSETPTESQIVVTWQWKARTLTWISSSEINDVLWDGDISGVLLSFPDTGLDHSLFCAVAHAQHMQRVGLGFPAKVYSCLFHINLYLLDVTAQKNEALTLQVEEDWLSGTHMPSLLAQR